MRDHTSNRSGLTLVEVLIALVLLAVVLLPVMLGFSQALLATGQSSISAVATSIGRDKMEELKATEYDLLASQGRETRDLNPGDSFFEVAVVVETIRENDAVGSGLKEAAVSVYRTGSADAVTTISTYFTPDGI